MNGYEMVFWVTIVLILMIKKCLVIALFYFWLEAAINLKGTLKVKENIVIAKAVSKKTDKYLNFIVALLSIRL